MRADRTLRDFQKLIADYQEVQPAKLILAELEAAAAPVDALTIDFLRQCVEAKDPFRYGADVALRKLTHVLHGGRVDEVEF